MIIFYFDSFLIIASRLLLARYVYECSVYAYYFINIMMCGIMCRLPRIYTIFSTVVVHNRTGYYYCSDVVLAEIFFRSDFVFSFKIIENCLHNSTVTCIISYMLFQFTGICNLQAGRLSSTFALI